MNKSVDKCSGERCACKQKPTEADIRIISDAPLRAGDAVDRAMIQLALRQRRVDL